MLLNSQNLENMLNLCEEIFKFEKNNELSLESIWFQLLNYLLQGLKYFDGQSTSAVHLPTLSPPYLSNAYINTIARLLKKSKKAVSKLNEELSQTHDHKVEFEFLDQIRPIREAFFKCARQYPNYLTCDVGQVIYGVLCAENFSNKGSVISKSLLDALEKKIYFNYHLPTKLSGYLFYIIGHGHLALRDFSSAIKYFSQVINSDPEFWEAYFCRGIAYTQQGLDRYEQALHSFKYLIENKSRVPSFILEKTYHAYGYTRYVWIGGNIEKSLSKCNSLRKQLGLGVVKRIFFENNIKMWKHGFLNCWIFILILSGMILQTIWLVTPWMSLSRARIIFYTSTTTAVT